MILEEKNLPKHIIDLAQKFNLSESSLEPEEYLFHTLYLPPEFHQALVEATAIDPNNLLTKDELIKDLYTSINENGFTFMGVDHASYRDHEAIAHILAKLDLEAVAIAIEYPPRLQDRIDLFLSTGVFRVGDDPTLYTQIYKASMRSPRFVAEIPQNLRGTFLDEFRDLEQIYPVLLMARAKGVPVVCFDRLGEIEKTRTQASEDEMYKILSGIQKKKVIVVAGAYHIKQGRYVDGENDVVSVRALCNERGKRTRSYKFDSRQADVTYDWMTDEVTETVLHAAIMKKSDTVGKRKNIVGYQNKSVEELTGAEIYVAVA